MHFTTYKSCIKMDKTFKYKWAFILLTGNMNIQVFNKRFLMSILSDI